RCGRMILGRDLVARRADLVGMRGRHDRRRHVVGAVVLELVEPHVWPPRQRRLVVGRRQVLYIEDALGVDGHLGSFVLGMLGQRAAGVVLSSRRAGQRRGAMPIAKERTTAWPDFSRVSASST